MKIVCVDNFARETHSDRLVAENIKSANEALVMCEALRKDKKRGDDEWFNVKPDDYQLYKFDPT